VKGDEEETSSPKCPIAYEKRHPIGGTGGGQLLMMGQGRGRGASKRQLKLEDNLPLIRGLVLGKPGGRTQGGEELLFSHLQSWVSETNEIDQLLRPGKAESMIKSKARHALILGINENRYRQKRRPQGR